MLYILYTGKYSYPFYFCVFCPCYQRGIEFKTGWIPMSQIKSIFKNNYVWENLRQGKTICKWRKEKITRGENYPVYSTGILIWVVTAVNTKWSGTWTTLYRLVFDTDLAIKYSNTHMVNVSILIVKIKTGKQLNFTIITG